MNNRNRMVENAKAEQEEGSAQGTIFVMVSTTSSSLQQAYT
jgi:hypothetical protein